MKKTIVLTVASLLFLCFFTAVTCAQESKIDVKNLNLKSGGQYFNSSMHQSGIKSGKSLGKIAEENSPLGKEALSLGFAAKSEESKFFIIGTLSSEIIAYLKSGNSELASKSLDALGKEFIALSVPSSLYSFVTKTRTMVETKKYSKEFMEEIFSLFQPFFEDYAKSKSQDKLILFRSGSWLVDMSLTAAAGDTELLRQTGTLNYFIKEMQRMDAPKGVMEALDGIRKIAEKKELTDKDADKVLSLVKKIQTILG